MVDDRFRSVDFDDPLQPVVSVDDAAIKIVEVGGSKATTVQLNHRAKLWRDDGHDVQNHPLGSASRGNQSLHDFKSLDRSGSSLTLGHDDFLTKFASKSLKVHASKEFLDCFCADVCAEHATEILVQTMANAIEKLGDGAILVLIDKLVLFQLAEDFHRDVEVLQAIVCISVLSLDSIVDSLGSLSNKRLVEVVVRVLNELSCESSEGFLFQLTHLHKNAGLLLLDAALNLGKHFIDQLLVDIDDDEACKVDDLLKQPWGNIKDERQGGWHAL